MFKELSPLLRQRAVVIMVNFVEADQLSVAIFPKNLNDSENAALSTPVILNGTPEELDEQIPSTLTEFVGAHLHLKNSLEFAKEEMAQAAKAARQESKTKTTTPTVDGATSSAGKPKEKKPATTPVKQIEAKTSELATTANLFDFGAIPSSVAVVAPIPAQVSVESDTDEEAEILSEIENGQDPEIEVLDSAA